jgi:purine-binding chemotaxis protein CheW
MKTMQTETTDKLTTDKFIVFIIAGYHLALPIQTVLQVIAHPGVTDELRKSGVVQVGRHMLRVLDLRQQLDADQLDADHSVTPTDTPFLVLTHHQPGELCAIPVSEPPNLLEFPAEMLRSLPQSAAQTGVLQVASHAATLSQGDSAETVFLLDLNRVLNPVAVLRLLEMQEQYR